MRRAALTALAVLCLLGWIHLLSVPTAAQGAYVEVTFRCPPGSGLLTFNWTNPLGGEYTEAGKKHDLKFRLSTMSTAPQLFSEGGPRQSSGGLRCEYRSGGSQPSYHAVYLYDVHREIIGCTSNGSALVCKLKP